MSVNKIRGYRTCDWQDGKMLGESGFFDIQAVLLHLQTSQFMVVPGGGFSHACGCLQHHRLQGLVAIVIWAAGFLVCDCDNRDNVSRLHSPGFYQYFMTVFNRMGTLCDL